jgi:hypothetical protein
MKDNLFASGKRQDRNRCELTIGYKDSSGPGGHLRVAGRRKKEDDIFELAADAASSQTRPPSSAGGWETCVWNGGNEMSGVNGCSNGR